MAVVWARTGLSEVGYSGGGLGFGEVLEEFSDSAGGYADAEESTVKFTVHGVEVEFGEFVV